MSSVTLIDKFSVLLSNYGMQTIEEIRVLRLLILRKEFGGNTALAEKLGISTAQLSQWINQSPDSKTKKPRTMSSESARKVEIITGKERGWMDQPVYSNDQKLMNMFDTLTTMDEPELKKINDVIKVIFPEKKKSEG